MFSSIDRRWLIAGIIVVLVLGAALPASAMDKLWRFWKPAEITPDYANDYPRVRAFTNAMEVVSEQHDSWRTPWEVPTDGTNVDYVLKSGVYCTRILYNDLPPSEGDLPINTSTGEQWSWDQAAKIGWSTSDGSCRLSELSWVYKDGTTTNVESIVDLEDVGSEVPGGGYVIGQEPNYVWYVTNDTGYLLKLINAELTQVQEPPWHLGLDYLSTAAEEGSIGLLIRTLGDSVMDAWAKGDLTDPSAKSLLGKLASASEDHLAGLAAAKAGNLLEAEKCWAAAIKHVETFIKEIETSMKTGKIREDLALLWVPIAETIVRRLDFLPDIDPDAAPLGTYAELEPGASMAIEFQAEDGDAVMIQGVLEDQETGEVVLNWVDKVDIKADMIPPVVDLYVNGEYVDPDTDLPLPWYSEDVTVRLASDDPDLASIQVVEHPYYDPEDPTEHPLPAPMDAGSEWVKTFSAEGIYVVAFWGVDTSGNTSELQSITIRIDRTAPQITVSPANLWPPDHGYVPIEIRVRDDNAGVDGWQCNGPVLSNEPDNGTGDGDCPIDIVEDWDDIDGDGVYLWLRAERAGPLTTRWYTFTIWARDLAGNEATLPVAIPVAHDQGG